MDELRPKPRSVLQWYDDAMEVLTRCRRDAAGATTLPLAVDLQQARQLAEELVAIEVRMGRRF